MTMADEMQINPERSNIGIPLVRRASNIYSRGPLMLLLVFAITFTFGANLVHGEHRRAAPGTFAFSNGTTNKMGPISTLFPPTTSTPINGTRHCWYYYEHCGNIFLNVSRASLKGEKVRLRGKQVNANLRPETISHEAYDMTRCYCDDRCDVYGDCCFDKVAERAMAISDGIPNDDIEIEEWESKMTTKTETIISGQWKCHHIPIHLKGDRHQTLSVYMMSACPPEWEDQHVLDRCLRRNTHKFRYDYTLDLPAYSVVTNITYVNMYCAICHNDVNILRWKLHILCPTPRPNCTKDTANWQYVPGDKRWRYQGFNVTYDLEVDAANATEVDAANPTEVDDVSPTKADAANPTEVDAANETGYYQRYGTRRCRDDVISSCAEDWPKGGAVRRLCDAYALYVKSDHLIYKNEYCVLCNRASTSNLQCPTVIYVEPTRFAGPKTRPPGKSYSLLLDFWSNDGSERVSESHRCGAHYCSFGEFCDPLHQRCRPYTCGRKYRMADDGQCVLVATEDDIGTTVDGLGEYDATGVSRLPTLEEDCAKAYVHHGNFVWLPGSQGAVHINRTRRTYNASQYELVNETTILVCVDDVYIHAWRFSLAQSLLSSVLVTFSLVCLAVHMVIHFATPQLLNLPGKNLVCLSCSLFVAQLCFEFGVGQEGVPVLCTIIALTIHFGFLASFFWMNVMAIDVCCTFANKQMRGGSSGLFRKYSVYAWLNPTVVVGLALLNDTLGYLPEYRPDYAQPLCWINNRKALLLYFAGPLALLLLVNVILFLLTVIGILRTIRATRMARQDSSGSSSGVANDTIRILLYTKLALIMGLTWVFGFVAALASDVEFLWYVFIVFNALQGTFIFVAFSCKRQVLVMVRERFSSNFQRMRASNANTSKRASAVTKSTVITSIKGDQESTASCLPSPKGTNAFSVKFTTKATGW